MQNGAWAALLLSAAAPNFAAATGIDINVSDESAALAVRNPIGLKIENLKNSDVELGFFYKDDPKNTMMGNLGFEVSGGAGAGAPGLDLGAGLKAYLGTFADYDVGAITLGLMARYAPPVAQRFFMSLRGNYSPNVLTFNDGDSFFEFNGRLGYEILPEVEIYAGYRNIEVELDNGAEIKPDDGWHIGFSFVF